MKDVIQEITSDSEEMRRLAESYSELGDAVSSEIAAGLCLYNDMVDRNKRYCLGYINHRLQKIDELRFEVGRLVPEDKLGKLTPSELRYMELHNGLLDDYMKRYVPDAKEP